MDARTWQYNRDELITALAFYQAHIDRVLPGKKGSDVIPIADAEEGKFSFHEVEVAKGQHTETAFILRWEGTEEGESDVF